MTIDDGTEEQTLFGPYNTVNLFLIIILHSLSFHKIETEGSLSLQHQIHPLQIVITRPLINPIVDEEKQRRSEQQQ